MMALPVRPTVFADEAAYLFMLRLADQVGFPSGRTFCYAHGLNFQSLVSGQQSGKLAKLAGLSVDVFDRSTFVRTAEGATRIGSEVLPQFDWSPHALKVCPRCLEEDRFVKGRPGEKTEHIRSWWMLTHLTACPFHRVRLITEPQPGWGKFENYPMRLLRDGFRSRHLSLHDLQIVPVETAEAEKYILGRIGFAPRIERSFLDGMPLSHAIRLMDRMGAVAALGKRAHTFGGIVDQNIALNRGFELFGGECEGFVGMLDTLAREAQRVRSHWAASDVYGRAYQWLNEVQDDPIYQPVIEIVRRHALENIPVSPDIPLFGRPVGERQLFRLIHIYQESGVHWDKAGNILRAVGEIAQDETDPIFKRDEALRIIAFLKDTMSHNVARDYLGMTIATIKNLLDAGLVVPRIRAGESGVSEHVFLKSELDGIVAKARGRATKVFNEQTSVFKNIIGAARYASTSCSEILRMLLDGRISCVGILKGKTGLGAILVDYRFARHAIPSRPAEYLNMDDLQKHLRVQFYTAQQLVRLGYIGTCEYRETVRKGTRSTFIHVDEANRFMKEFASAQEIAEAQGTHVRVLVPELRDRGVSLAMTNSDVGRYYYRRVDVEGIDLPKGRRRRRGSSLRDAAT
ncbi:TniQ family protein [Phyllobacterium sp. LjRoot231]|uniref:TniQ family protein n=1 Tax=Phyllobacterium sp. LjRoot231 TaxID=3342289 RepID=UPI003ECF2FE1